jgi:hypothetical protein
LKVVDDFGNDAVIITRLIEVEKEEIQISPRLTNRYCYDHYSNAYALCRGPVRENTFVRLETNLYDAKTEKLIWTGQSQTWQYGSDKEIIDEVIKAVVDALQEDELLPKK